MPEVTVRGEATVETKPDEARLSVEVSALERTPADALAEAARRGEALDRVLDELGVASERRTTTGVTVHEEREYDGSTVVHRGYRARAVVLVRLADASSIGRLLSEATARAKARAAGPVWHVAPDNPARAEACRRAAEEARRKAQAYADALGLRLGAVVTIREPAAEQRIVRHGEAMVAMAAGPASAPDLDVHPGQVEVGASVDVTFALEPA